MIFINKYSKMQRAGVFIFIVCFIMSCLFSSTLYAQIVSPMPASGVMVSLSSKYDPVVLRGIKIFPENPLRFDFIIDKGQADFNEEALEAESSRLIKYFLTTLTIPEDDLWVNLSPYEKDRIIPNEFGFTEMGRDLLAQDYLLKQITASLMYPEKDLGLEFWDAVYDKAYREYGLTEIPVDIFSKVWIVPQKAVVYEDGDRAFVIESKLKVMLEDDYLAFQKKGEDAVSKEGVSGLLSKLSDRNEMSKDQRALTTQMIRSIIIPALEKEVNEGANFSTLRQVYNSMILATWFKRKLKAFVESSDDVEDNKIPLMSKLYVGKNMVDGIDVKDKKIKEKIYQQYLAAFNEGVYEYIKEEYDPVSKQIIPRKYFSGGMDVIDVDGKMEILRDKSMLSKSVSRLLLSSMVIAGVVLGDAFVDEGLATALDSGPGVVMRKEQVLPSYFDGVEVLYYDKDTARFDVKEEMKEKMISRFEDYFTQKGVVVKGQFTNLLRRLPSDFIREQISKVYPSTSLVWKDNVLSQIFILSDGLNEGQLNVPPEILVLKRLLEEDPEQAFAYLEQHLGKKISFRWIILNDMDILHAFLESDFERAAQLFHKPVPEGVLRSDMLLLASINFEVFLEMLNFAEQNDLEGNINKMFSVMGYVSPRYLVEKEVSNEEVRNIYEKLKDAKGVDWLANHMVTSYMTNLDGYYEDIDFVIEKFKTSLDEGMGIGKNALGPMFDLEEKRVELDRSRLLFFDVNGFPLRNQILPGYSEKKFIIYLGFLANIKLVPKEAAYKFGKQYYELGDKHADPYILTIAEDLLGRAVEGSDYEFGDDNLTYRDIFNGEISAEDLGLNEDVQDGDGGSDVESENTEDAAMMGLEKNFRQASKEVGGIDLNPENLDIEMQGNGVNLFSMENIDISDFENFTGFTPIIFQMTPGTNLPSFFGLK